MRRPIGWSARSSDGAKLRVEARLFGGAIRFFRQARRYESWEAFEPEEEDWETLEELALNRFKRGKLKKEELALIRARGKPGSGAQPRRAV